jgi:hypothetical protein
MDYGPTSIGNVRSFLEGPQQFVGQHRVTWHLVPREVLERAE